MMKYLFLCLMLVTALAADAQSSASKASKTLLKLVDRRLMQSQRQYYSLMRQTPADSFPEVFTPATGKITMGSSKSWMCGFYPGSLLYLVEAGRMLPHDRQMDSVLYQAALGKLKELEKEQYNKGTHDIGFMMYCPYGNALRIAPDPSYKNIIVNSARSLASRFNEKTGCIRSWNSDPGRFMVIIDNMMNLELLFAATRLSGDSSFYRIAVTHANTTIKNHYRPDHSSYHLVIYDPETGAIQKKQTVQGAFDSSAWARGQAWGLYGYTVMYRETKDKKYLDHANGIARFITGHLPADKMPYWDFNAPGIPHTDRDVSAATITCSALLELCNYVEPGEGKKYFSIAEAMLRKLSSPEYFAQPISNGGFLLKHGVGNFPKHADIDVALIYADYYYIEALLRYRSLGKK